MNKILSRCTFQKFFLVLVLTLHYQTVSGFGVDSANLLSEEDIQAFEEQHIGNPESIEKGRELYGNTCLFCHGPEGAGARAPTLVDKAFAPGGGNDNVYFINTIRNGREGTIMGSFIGTISDDEMWEIIAYLRDVSMKLAE